MHRTITRFGSIVAAATVATSLAMPAAAQTIPGLPDDADLPYADPNNHWVGWDYNTPLAPSDPGFWDPNVMDDRVVSTQGTDNIVCEYIRWSTGDCYQNGEKMPAMSSHGWNKFYVNVPGLNGVFEAISPITYGVGNFVDSSSFVSSNPALLSSSPGYVVDELVRGPSMMSSQ